MTRHNPAAIAVAALLLVAGCSSGSSTKTEAHCSAQDQAACSSNPVPTAAPRPSSLPGQLMGVITKDGRLELFEVGPDRPVARLLRELPGPSGMSAEQVALAAGADPRVCATWSGKAKGVLRCYDAAAPEGRDVDTHGHDVVGALGLSTSGRGIAWVGAEKPGDPPALSVLRFGDAAVMTLPAYGTAQDEDEATLLAGDVAWSGEDTVLVSHSWDADVNGSVAKVSLTKPPRGWTDAPVVELGGEWPVVLGASSSTDDGHLLVLLEGFRGDDGREVFEAADADLRTGRVADVVAVPAARRWLIHVSGGRRGVLYRTQGDDVHDIRDYWRAPGQKHGARITGLPADVAVVVAQP